MCHFISIEIIFNIRTWYLSNPGHIFAQEKYRRLFLHRRNCLIFKKTKLSFSWSLIGLGMLFYWKNNESGYECSRNMYLFLWELCMVPSWPWSYGSWIYNYLCNQCLSPIMLWFRTPFIARCTGYNILW